MSIVSLPRPWRFALVGTCLLALIGGLGLTLPVASGDDLTDLVVRVEEDWELVLNEPGVPVDAPQFHTLMSPQGDLDAWHFQVTWNYREYPSFVQGGLQVQGWHGQELLEFNDCEAKQMSTVGETIRWTQVLGTDGDDLSFGVVDGHSTSWGEFGGDHVKITKDADVSNLNRYNSLISLQNSWITYGANRVHSLAIKEVRYYGEDGLLLTDSTPKVVHSQN